MDSAGPHDIRHSVRVDEGTTPPYDQAFEALRGLYLEDSWVLGVEAHDSGITFDLDAVLTEEHPLYRVPRPDEQYCYRRGTLRIDGAVSFRASDAPPARDASGELDYGNIDAFTAIGGDRWRVQGEWGIAEVTGPKVRVSLEGE